MTIEEMFRDKSDEQISAFAFNTGRLLEHIVETRVGNLVDKNAELEANIIIYRNLLLKELVDAKDRIVQTELTETINRILCSFDSTFGIIKN